uniref:Ubiquitin-conjugating enzyme E2 (RUB1 homologue), putative n=1 Tax=Theileria annulata TaxID=5874 RepID=A0A3B0MRK4_THEAN
MLDHLNNSLTPNLHGEITLDKVAHVKDETVRFLEKRSFDLVSFTYSYEPERAPEINKMLEDDLDNLLLNSHRQLAYHRLYGDNKTNVAQYNSNLRRLEILAKEVESCYDRFQAVKKNNPDPTKVAIIHIFGVDDLEKRLLNLRNQGQVIFYKQVQVASLIDEFAMYKGVYLKDHVADKAHKTCLSQTASELSVDSWALRIKYCKDTLENIKAEAQKSHVSGINGRSGRVLSEEQEKNFHDAISNNSKLIHQLTRELSELRMYEGVEIRFPDINNIMNMEILIKPREGIYKDMKITFSFHIPNQYPNDRPKIYCTSKIIHPNILGTNADKCKGAVCLNILREDWLPIYTIDTAIIGLVNLLIEPQFENPLDKFAANLLQKDPMHLRSINLSLNYTT